MKPQQPPVATAAATASYSACVYSRMCTMVRQLGGAAMRGLLTVHRRTIYHIMATNQVDSELVSTVAYTDDTATWRCSGASRPTHCLAGLATKQDGSEPVSTLHYSFEDLWTRQARVWE
jgi:hypothetical protein